MLENAQQFLTAVTGVWLVVTVMEERIYSSLSSSLSPFSLSLFLSLLFLPLPRLSEYGVTEAFTPEDLVNKTNMPAVVATILKLAEQVNLLFLLLLLFYCF